jgi:hypothetical protein
MRPQRAQRKKRNELQTVLIVYLKPLICLFPLSKYVPHGRFYLHSTECRVGIISDYEEK